MIDDLYDSVLSITNQTGYLDRINDLNIKSPLIWSFNNNQQLCGWDISNPPYTIIIFSHDNNFITPFSSLIHEDGIYENIYIHGN